MSLTKRPAFHDFSQNSFYRVANSGVKVLTVFTTFMVSLLLPHLRIIIAINFKYRFWILFLIYWMIPIMSKLWQFVDIAKTIWSIFCFHLFMFISFVQVRVQIQECIFNILKGWNSHLPKIWFFELTTVNLDFSSIDTRHTLKYKKSPSLFDKCHIQHYYFEVDKNRLSSKFCSTRIATPSEWDECRWWTTQPTHLSNSCQYCNFCFSHPTCHFIW